jgi:Protein of unknown function (DUF3592)
VGQVRELMSWLFLLAGVASAIFSLVLFFRTLRFLRVSVEAEGRISRLERTSTGGGKFGQYMYAPVFFFTAADGKTYTVISKATTYSPSFGIGERVSVLYDPANPEDARIHTFFQTWGNAVVLGICGLFFVATGCNFPGVLHWPGH